MKNFSIFLAISFIIVTLATITLGANNQGESERISPSGDEITRSAYDADYKLYSEAYTSATQGTTGHSVSASNTPGSFNDPWLAGSYARYATLNHDWVNNRDGDNDGDGEWEGYISRWTNANDKDWWNSYDPSSTIEYCVTNGWISAKDIRTPSVRYGTSVYIPW